MEAEESLFEIPPCLFKERGYFVTGGEDNI
jgi:hypothetical protein